MQFANAVTTSPGAMRTLVTGAYVDKDPNGRNRVTFNGQNYNVTGFNNPAEIEALHIMQAIDLKSNTKGLFDWQLTLSDYDYQKDKSSASNVGTSVSITGANGGNPYVNRIGRVTDLDGTGWTVFDARGTLRPKDGHDNQHTIEFGYHIDDYNLRSTVHNTAD